MSTFWDRAGIPQSGVKNLDANLSGGSTVGAVCFLNPTSGDAFLAYWSSNAPVASANSGGIMLCDRLWESGSLSATILTSQAITSGPWPARDENGSTNGDGVFLGVEVTSTTAGGSADLLYNVTYTNSANVGSRAGQTVFIPSARNVPGTYLFSLDTGDVGVRSVQSFQITGTTAHTSGAFNLVAYRPLAFLSQRAGTFATHDPITGGVPKIWPDSVLYFMGQTGESNSGYPGHVSGKMIFAWG